MLPFVFCNDLIFPEYRQRSVLLMEARKYFNQYWSILTQGSVLLLQTLPLVTMVSHRPLCTYSDKGTIHGAEFTDLSSCAVPAAAASCPLTVLLRSWFKCFS